MWVRLPVWSDVGIYDITAIAGVKNFLNDATQQVQSTDDLNAEVVSEGEAYIEMVCYNLPLQFYDINGRFLRH